MFCNIFSTMWLCNNIMCDVCLDWRILTVFGGGGVVFLLVFLRSMHAF